MDKFVEMEIVTEPDPRLDLMDEMAESMKEIYKTIMCTDTVMDKTIMGTIDSLLTRYEKLGKSR